MWLGKTLIFLLGPLVRALMRVELRGKENIPLTKGEPPLVLCCNHLSMWDPVLLVVSFPRPIHFMAKAELFKCKPLGWLIGKQFGAFPVHRGKGDTGALDYGKQLVNDGKIMGIFPEGTRSKDGRPGRAKSGAAFIVAGAGAHVLPVAVVPSGKKPRLFRKTVIAVGKPLSPEELHLAGGERPDIRYGSRAIMGAITQLMEDVR